MNVDMSDARDVNDRAATAAAAAAAKNYDLILDLSALPSLTALSATSCSLLDGGILLLRLVDEYGTILSLLLDHGSANLHPRKGHLRPLQIEASMAPHPGATVDHCQIAFLGGGVLLAMDPHLYFVEDVLSLSLFSDGHNDNYDYNDDDDHCHNNIQTWSLHHKLTRDPFQPSTFGQILKEASITLGMKTREAEDGRERLPSVSALVCLNDETGIHNGGDDGTNNYDDNEQRIITLHSDGTLRLWTSTPTPLVRRIVLPSNDGYIDPPLSPSQWDSFASIKMSGRFRNDSYELGLCLQCRNGPMVHVLTGGENGDDMRTVSLPEGEVVDLMWEEKEGLCVLMRGREGEKVVVFPRGEVEAVLPESRGFGSGRMGKLTVEEELERYFVPAKVEEDETMEDAEDESSEGQPSQTLEEKVAKVEKAVDKAGLLSLLQPYGRSRPTALAVHRALLGLNLSDEKTRAESLTPTYIVGAMRKWKKRDLFRPSSEETALIVREESDALVVKSPEAESDSIYHMFASAKKEVSSRPSTADDSREVVANLSIRFSGVNDVESAENKHLMRWITFLGEVRRQEAILNEALCLSSIPSTGNLFVRSNGISSFSFEDSVEDNGPLGYEGEGLMARLDELSLGMLEFIMSNPELRRTLCHIESLLHRSASKAACLISSQRSEGLDNELISEMGTLGLSALAEMNLDDRQMELGRILSELDLDFIEEWSHPASTLSPSIRIGLGLPSNATASSDVVRFGGKDAQTSVVTTTTAYLESIRKLTLARSLLVLSSVRDAASPSYEIGLRACLFCTALLWSVNQPSYQNSSCTALEHHFSQEVNAALPTNVSNLANSFIEDIFRFYSGASGTTSSSFSFLSSTNEPRTTLRLVAPLVEYPVHGSSISPSVIQAAAKCLLVEASFAAKQHSANEASVTSPESLWESASTLLLGVAPMESMNDISTNEELESLLARVGVLEAHLRLMEHDISILSGCCNITLSAIHDAISFITSNFDTSNETAEVSDLWSRAFETSLKGNLWDQALRSCVSSPLRDLQEANFRRLVLDMVGANALGKLIDMSMTVVQPHLESEDEMAETQLDICFDIFDASTKIIEEAAYHQSSVSTRTATEFETALNNVSSYWGALYTLQVSRGNWKQAAQAMDTCGKMIGSLSMPVTVNNAISKMIMDAASLSATACAHAISLVENPSDRYILTNREKGVLTKEDIESRAIRAQALRALSMDEFAPDSVSSILKATTHETINTLARLGYYEQALAVAKGLAKKRKSRPGGVDLFDDSLKHILSTYLVPAAINASDLKMSGDDADIDIQSRSKIAQIRLSSSACITANPSLPNAVDASSTNSQCFLSNKHCDEIVQADLAMNLLRQYTTTYFQSCTGLCLHVARSIFFMSRGTYALPRWLVELCTFGVSSEDIVRNGLFASCQQKKQVADPAGLVHLLMEYHRYYEATEVVLSVLSKRNSQLAPSSRLPEKGSIDFIPYNMIDALYYYIDTIITTAKRTNFEVENHVKALELVKRRLEKALMKHFEMMKLSEEGLTSARALAVL